MKMYDKKDLEYKNGLLVASDGTVMGIDPEIIDLANELETRIQKAEYLAAQPGAVAVPSLDGFTRKSETEMQKFVCETPIMDKKVEESLKFMEEIEDVQVTNKLNDDLAGLMPLVQFAKDSSIVSMDHVAPRKFDVPTMGNPLKWDEDKLMVFVAMANGISKEDDSDESVVVAESTVV